MKEGTEEWALLISKMRYNRGMSTLSEIEQAADALPADQKQELLFFLAARLRAQGAAPTKPRKFTSEQMRAWIAEDEADMRRLSENK